MGEAAILQQLRNMTKAGLKFYGQIFCTINIMAE